MQGVVGGGSSGQTCAVDGWPAVVTARRAVTAPLQRDDTRPPVGCFAARSSLKDMLKNRGMCSKNGSLTIVSMTSNSSTGRCAGGVAPALLRPSVAAAAAATAALCA
jgi:hypothetical protein